MRELWSGGGTTAFRCLLVVSLLSVVSGQFINYPLREVGGPFTNTVLPSSLIVGTEGNCDRQIPDSPLTECLMTTIETLNGLHIGLENSVGTLRLSWGMSNAVTDFVLMVLTSVANTGSNSLDISGIATLPTSEALCGPTETEYKCLRYEFSTSSTNLLTVILSAASPEPYYLINMYGYNAGFQGDYILAFDNIGITNMVPPLTNTLQHHYAHWGVSSFKGEYSTFSVDRNLNSIKATSSTPFEIKFLHTVADVGMVIWSMTPNFVMNYVAVISGGMTEMTTIDVSDTSSIYRSYICGTHDVNTPTYATCADVVISSSPWADVDGRTCATYQSMGLCSQPDSFHIAAANNGHDARSACCFCNGGSTANKYCVDLNHDNTALSHIDPEGIRIEVTGTTIVHVDSVQYTPLAIAKAIVRSEKLIDFDNVATSPIEAGEYASSYVTLTGTTLAREQRNTWKSALQMECWEDSISGSLSVDFKATSTPDGTDIPVLVKYVSFYVRVASPDQGLALTVRGLRDSKTIETKTDTVTKACGTGYCQAFHFSVAVTSITISTTVSTAALICVDDIDIVFSAVTASQRLSGLYNQVFAETAGNFEPDSLRSKHIGLISTSPAGVNTRSADGVYTIAASQTSNILFQAYAQIRITFVSQTLGALTAQSIPFGQPTTPLFKTISSQTSNLIASWTISATQLELVTTNPAGIRSIAYSFDDSPVIPQGSLHIPFSEFAGGPPLRNSLNTLSLLIDSLGSSSVLSFPTTNGVTHWAISASTHEVISFSGIGVRLRMSVVVTDMGMTPSTCTVTRMSNSGTETAVDLVFTNCDTTGNFKCSQFVDNELSISFTIFCDSAIAITTFVHSATEDPTPSTIFYENFEYDSTPSTWNGHLNIEGTFSFVSMGGFLNQKVIRCGGVSDSLAISFLIGDRQYHPEYLSFVISKPTTTDMTIKARVTSIHDLNDFVITIPFSTEAVPCAQKIAGFTCYLYTYVNGGENFMRFEISSPDEFFVNDLRHSFRRITGIPGIKAANFDNKGLVSTVVPDAYHDIGIYEWGSAIAKSVDSSIAIFVTAANPANIRSYFGKLFTNLGFLVASYSVKFTATIQIDGTTVKTVTETDTILCADHTVEKPPGIACSDQALPNGDPWVDSLGQSCAYYVNNGECANEGATETFRNTFIASEACCGCGGGSARNGYCYFYTYSNVASPVNEVVISTMGSDHVLIDNFIFSSDQTQVKPTGVIALDFDDPSRQLGFSGEHYIVSATPTIQSLITGYTSTNAMQTPQADIRFEFGHIISGLTISLPVDELSLVIISDSSTSSFKILTYQGGITAGDELTTSGSVITDYSCGTQFCALMVIEKSFADGVRIVEDSGSTAFCWIDDLVFTFDGSMKLPSEDFFSLDFINWGSEPFTYYRQKYIYTVTSSLSLGPLSVAPNIIKTLQRLAVPIGNSFEINFLFLEVRHLQLVVHGLSGDTSVTVTIAKKRKGTIISSTVLNLAMSDASDTEFGFYRTTAADDPFDALELSSTFNFEVADIYYSFSETILESPPGVFIFGSSEFAAAGSPMDNRASPHILTFGQGSRLPTTRTTSLITLSSGAATAWKLENPTMSDAMVFFRFPANFVTVKFATATMARTVTVKLMDPEPVSTSIVEINIQCGSSPVMFCGEVSFIFPNPRGGRRLEISASTDDTDLFVRYISYAFDGKGPVGTTNFDFSTYEANQVVSGYVDEKFFSLTNTFPVDGTTFSKKSLQLPSSGSVTFEFTPPIIALSVLVSSPGPVTFTTSYEAFNGVQQIVNPSHECGANQPNDEVCNTLLIPSTSINHLVIAADSSGAHVRELTYYFGIGTPAPSVIQEGVLRFSFDDVGLPTLVRRDSYATAMLRWFPDAVVGYDGFALVGNSATAAGFTTKNEVKSVLLTLISFTVPFQFTHITSLAGSTVTSGTLTQANAHVCGTHEVPRPANALTLCNDLLVDGLAWRDTDAFSCADYKANSMCDIEGGDVSKRNTYIGNEACCECGGGDQDKVYCIEFSTTDVFDKISFTESGLGGTREVYVDNVRLSFFENGLLSGRKIQTFDVATDFASNAFVADGIQSLGPLTTITSNTWSPMSNVIEAAFGDGVMLYPVDLKFTICIAETNRDLEINFHHKRNNLIISNNLFRLSAKSFSDQFCTTVSAVQVDGFKITSSVFAPVFIDRLTYFIGGNSQFIPPTGVLSALDQNSFPTGNFNRFLFEDKYLVMYRVANTDDTTLEIIAPALSVVGYQLQVTEQHIIEFGYKTATKAIMTFTTTTSGLTLAVDKLLGGVSTVLTYTFSADIVAGQFRTSVTLDNVDTVKLTPSSGLVAQSVFLTHIVYSFDDTPVIPNNVLVAKFLQNGNFDDYFNPGGSTDLQNLNNRNQRHFISHIGDISSQGPYVVEVPFVLPSWVGMVMTGSNSYGVAFGNFLVTGAHITLAVHSSTTNSRTVNFVKTQSDGTQTTTNVVLDAYKCSNAGSYSCLEFFYHGGDTFASCHFEFTRDADANNAYWLQTRYVLGSDTISPVGVQTLNNGGIAAGQPIAVAPHLEITPSSFVVGPNGGTVVPSGTIVFKFAHLCTGFKATIRTATLQVSSQLRIYYRDWTETVSVETTQTCGSQFCYTIVLSKMFSTMTYTPVEQVDIIVSSAIEIVDISYTFDDTEIIPTGRLSANFDDIGQSTGPTRSSAYSDKLVYHWGEWSQFSFDNSISMLVTDSSPGLFNTHIPMKAHRFTVASYDTIHQFTVTRGVSVVNYDQTTAHECAGTSVKKPSRVCTDLTLAAGGPWVDSAGDSCSDYASLDNCQTSGATDMFRNEFIASEACCACDAGSASKVLCHYITSDIEIDSLTITTTQSGLTLSVDNFIFSFTDTVLFPSTKQVADFEGLSGFSETNNYKSFGLLSLNPASSLTTVDGSQVWSASSGSSLKFGVEVQGGTVPIPAAIKMVIRTDTVIDVIVKGNNGGQPLRSRTEAISDPCDLSIPTGPFCATVVVGLVEEVELTSTTPAANIYVDDIQFSLEPSSPDTVVLLEGVFRQQFPSDLVHQALVDSYYISSVSEVSSPSTLCADPCPVNLVTGGVTNGGLDFSTGGRSIKFSHIRVTHFRVMVFCDVSSTTITVTKRLAVATAPETITMLNSPPVSSGSGTTTFAVMYESTSPFHEITFASAAGSCYLDEMYYSFDETAVLPTGLQLVSTFTGNPFNHLSFFDPTTLIIGHDLGMTGTLTGGTPDVRNRMRLLNTIPNALTFGFSQIIRDIIIEFRIPQGSLLPGTSATIDIAVGSSIVQLEFTTTSAILLPTIGHYVKEYYVRGSDIPNFNIMTFSVSVTTFTIEQILFTFDNNGIIPTGLFEIDLSTDIGSGHVDAKHVQVIHPGASPVGTYDGNSAIILSGSSNTVTFLFKNPDGIKLSVRKFRVTFSTTSGSTLQITYSWKGDVVFSNSVPGTQTCGTIPGVMCDTFYVIDSLGTYSTALFDEITFTNPSAGDITLRDIKYSFDLTTDIVPGLQVADFNTLTDPLTGSELISNYIHISADRLEDTSFDGTSSLRLTPSTSVVLSAAHMPFLYSRFTIISFAEMFSGEVSLSLDGVIGSTVTFDQSSAYKCGGLDLRKPTDRTCQNLEIASMPWQDSMGRDCTSHYVDTVTCVADGSTEGLRNDGFVGREACCTCGGGSPIETYCYDFLTQVASDSLTITTSTTNNLYVDNFFYSFLPNTPKEDFYHLNFDSLPAVVTGTEFLNNFFHFDTTTSAASRWSTIVTPSVSRSLFWSGNTAVFGFRREVNSVNYPLAANFVRFTVVSTTNTQVYTIKSMVSELVVSSITVPMTTLCDPSAASIYCATVTLPDATQLVEITGSENEIEIDNLYYGFPTSTKTLNRFPDKSYMLDFDAFAPSFSSNFDAVLDYDVFFGPVPSLTTSSSRHVSYTPGIVNERIFFSWRNVQEVRLRLFTATPEVVTLMNGVGVPILVTIDNNYPLSGLRYAIVTLTSPINFIQIDIAGIQINSLTYTYDTVKYPITPTGFVRLPLTDSFESIAFNSVEYLIEMIAQVDSTTTFSNPTFPSTITVSDVGSSTAFDINTCGTAPVKGWVVTSPQVILFATNVQFVRMVFVSQTVGASYSIKLFNHDPSPTVLTGTISKPAGVSLFAEEHKIETTNFEYMTVESAEGMFIKEFQYSFVSSSYPTGVIKEDFQSFVGMSVPKQLPNSFIRLCSTGTSLASTSGLGLLSGNELSINFDGFTSAVRIEFSSLTQTTFTVTRFFLGFTVGGWSQSVTTSVPCEAGFCVSYLFDANGDSSQLFSLLTISSVTTDIFVSAVSHSLSGADVIFRGKLTIDFNANPLESTGYLSKEISNWGPTGSPFSYDGSRSLAISAGGVGHIRTAFVPMTSYRLVLTSFFPMFSIIVTHDSGSNTYTQADAFVCGGPEVPKPDLSSVCTDLTLPGGVTWTDTAMNGCDWYDATRCGNVGSSESLRSTYVANQACCVCGAGSTADVLCVIHASNTPTRSVAFSNAPGNGDIYVDNVVYSFGTQVVFPDESIVYTVDFDTCTTSFSEDQYVESNFVSLLGTSSRNCPAVANHKFPLSKSWNLPTTEVATMIFGIKVDGDVVPAQVRDIRFTLITDAVQTVSVTTSLATVSQTQEVIVNVPCQIASTAYYCATFVASNLDKVVVSVPTPVATNFFIDDVMYSFGDKILPLPEVFPGCSFFPLDCSVRLFNFGSAPTATSSEFVTQYVSTMGDLAIANDVSGLSPAPQLFKGYKFTSTAAAGYTFVISFSYLDVASFRITFWAPSVVDFTVNLIRQGSTVSTTVHQLYHKRSLDQFVFTLTRSNINFDTLSIVFNAPPMDVDVTCTSLYYTFKSMASAIPKGMFFFIYFLFLISVFKSKKPILFIMIIKKKKKKKKKNRCSSC